MRTLFHLFFLLLPGVLLAQTPLQKDLESLHQLLKHTKSYKQQPKARAAIKERVREYQAVEPRNSLEHLSYLVKAISPLNDRHLGLYEVPDLSLYRTYDPDRISLPKFEIPANETLDSKDSLVGIYHFGDWYTLAVFPAALPGEYLGVVTDTKVEHWKRGEIAAWLQRRDDGSLSAIYAHPYTKNYQWFSIEQQVAGTLLRSEIILNGKVMGLVKEGSPSTEQRKVHPSIPAFYHDKEAHYTRIKSFQKNAKTVRSTDSLLAVLRENRPDHYWIIDIRDQEGGAKSEMKKYWKVVKRYKGKVALLVNFNTLSQAELFVIKARRKVVVMGETTRGMLTYGSNFGKSQKLPSGKVMFYPTDMMGWPPHLRYEGKGIRPDLHLSLHQDWVEQARSYFTLKSD
jgi:hypothetical protein